MSNTPESQEKDNEVYRKIFDTVEVFIYPDPLGLKEFLTPIAQTAFQETVEALRSEGYPDKQISDMSALAIADAITDGMQGQVIRGDSIHDQVQNN